MTYDNTDANDDGTVDADVDNQSVSTDKQDIGDIHVLDATDSLSSAIVDYAGDTIDLAGRQYEIDATLSSSADGTTIQNGTVKLADGADSDLLNWTGNSLTLRDVTFDYNGANNSGSPTNQSYFTLLSDDLRVENCRFINAGGRGTQDDNAIYVESVDGILTKNKIELERNPRKDIELNTSSSGGDPMKFIHNIIKDSGKLVTATQDTIIMGNSIELCYQGIRVPSEANDTRIVGNIIEDNDYGIVVNGFDDTPNKSEQLYVANNSIQGNLNHAVWILDRVNGQARFTDNTFKLNQFENNGSGAVILIDAGGDIKFSPESIKNQDASKGKFAEYAFTINVADIHIDWPTVDDREYPGPAINDNGTRTIINGEARESANAEEPQSPFEPGVYVDFTDTGDGSGTGYYRKARDGRWIGPL